MSCGPFWRSSPCPQERAGPCKWRPILGSPCLNVKTAFSCLDCGVELSTMGQKEVRFFSPPLTAKCLEMLLFNIKSLIIRIFFPSKPLRTLGHLQQNSSVSALISCLINCLSFTSAEMLFRPLQSRAALAVLLTITSLSGMFNGQLFFSFHCSCLQSRLKI